VLKAWVRDTARVRAEGTAALIGPVEPKAPDTIPVVVIMDQQKKAEADA
jgi:hypothetical protein